jgi:Cu-Zn family superoxide dismutase
MKSWLQIIAVSILASALTGCMSDKEATPPTAIARLNPTQNNKVTGTVVFTKVAGGIRVVADIQGLAPGEHGFHIHEKGDCSAPDGASAGGHFNPTGMPHGAHNAAKRHIGDLGNLVADASGKAHIDRIDALLAFEGETSIIGRGVIVHDKKDDLVSQPAGNAGPRIACGVIEMQK